MQIKIRVETEEDQSDLFIWSYENDDTVYLSVGENTEVVQVKVETLQKALRVISTK